MKRDRIFLNMNLVRNVNKTCSMIIQSRWLCAIIVFAECFTSTNSFTLKLKRLDYRIDKYIVFLLWYIIIVMEH